MSKQDNGGPAFPVPCSVAPSGDFVWADGGMSRLDYFAAAALQGLLAAETPDSEFADRGGKTRQEWVAVESFSQAAAMLAESERRQS